MKVTDIVALNFLGSPACMAVNMFKPLQLIVLISLSLVTISTSILAPASFSVPQSRALNYTNLLIGNGGYDPNSSGGMIPSVSPPFGMTRWVAQTQVHYVSSTPYNWTLDKVMGFVGTRQPAIWMGESAPIIVCPGVGGVVVDFEQRGLVIARNDEGDKKEVITVGYYSVELEDGHGGSVFVEQTASGFIRFLPYSYFFILHSLTSCTIPLYIQVHA